MVDAEKPELNGMMDSQSPIPNEGGGEAEFSSSDAEDKAEVTPELRPTDDLNLEEEEYSSEEYKRYVDLYDRTLSDISEGQIVMGRVLAITDQEVLVDIGFKSEGTISLEEFGESPEIKVGDRIEVYLEAIEDSDGQLLLSRKKATFMRLWDKVVHVYNEGGTIEGKCMRRIKGGIVVDLMGVDAFLPGSQIDVKPIRDFDALIGQTFTFKVVKVNKLRKNIVVSRRVLLEESMEEQRKRVLVGIEKDQVYEGTVKNITDFGVFVDLGGVDGLLHINDLSWGRIKHPSEVVKLDERIKVKILDFNDAKDRISLGMKQLQPHPWEEIESKYSKDTVVKGKVVSIADYGAFVELEKGVEGLIHVSEMSWTRHGIHPSKIVNIGEIVEVKVLDIDKSRKRISLGLRQLTPDPWENIQEKYPVGSKYKGRVRNMTNFGTFVEMEEGIDGLIHISDLSWTRKIRHPSEVLKKGEEVEVVILEVNKEERRVSLGYKQLAEDPWPAFEEAYKVDTLTSGKVVRFVDKGFIVELPLGLEGFVPLSQMVEPSMVKVTQVMKVGDEMSFVVIEFDRENKRVVLSRKKAIDMEEQKEGEAEKTEVKAYLEKDEGAPTLEEIAGEKMGEREIEERETGEKETGEKETEEKETEEKETEEKETEEKETGEKETGEKETEEKETEEKETEEKETEEKESKEGEEGSGVAKKESTEGTKNGEAPAEEVKKT